MAHSQKCGIAVGDAVAVRGDTQDFILTDPEKKYRGRVIGREGAHLLIELDEPIVRGVNSITRATVHEDRAQLLS